MKKLLTAIFASMAMVAIAFAAGSYPSPTYQTVILNGVTSDGTLSSDAGVLYLNGSPVGTGTGSTYHAGNGLTLTTGTFSVNTGSNFIWSGSQTFSGTSGISLSIPGTTIGTGTTALLPDPNNFIDFSNTTSGTVGLGFVTVSGTDGSFATGLPGSPVVGLLSYAYYNQNETILGGDEFGFMAPLSDGVGGQNMVSVFGISIGVPGTSGTNGGTAGLLSSDENFIEQSLFFVHQGNAGGATGSGTGGNGGGETNNLWVMWFGPGGIESSSGIAGNGGNITVINGLYYTFTGTGGSGTSAGHAGRAGNFTNKLWDVGTGNGAASGTSSTTTSGHGGDISQGFQGISGSGGIAVGTTAGANGGTIGFFEFNGGAASGTVPGGNSGTYAVSGSGTFAGGSFLSRAGSTGPGASFTGTNATDPSLTYSVGATSYTDWWPSASGTLVLQTTGTLQTISLANGTGIAPSLTSGSSTNSGSAAVSGSSTSSGSAAVSGSSVVSGSASNAGSMSISGLTSGSSSATGTLSGNWIFSGSTNVTGTLNGNVAGGGGGSSSISSLTSGSTAATGTWGGTQTFNGTVNATSTLNSTNINIAQGATATFNASTTFFPLGSGTMLIINPGLTAFNVMMLSSNTSGGVGLWPNLASSGSSQTIPSLTVAAANSGTGISNLFVTGSLSLNGNGGILNNAGAYSGQISVLPTVATGTLVSGTGTISNGLITAHNTWVVDRASSVTNLGGLSVTVSGTVATVRSSNVLDTSVFDLFIQPGL